MKAKRPAPSPCNPSLSIHSNTRCPVSTPPHSAPTPPPSIFPTPFPFPFPSPPHPPPNLLSPTTLDQPHVHPPAVARHRLLQLAHRPPPTAHRPPPTAHRPPPTAHRLAARLTPRHSCSAGWEVISVASSCLRGCSQALVNADIAPRMLRQRRALRFLEAETCTHIRWYQLVQNFLLSNHLIPHNHLYFIRSMFLPPPQCPP
jgi:hypothetical protein